MLGYRTLEHLHRVCGCRVLEHLMSHYLPRCIILVDNEPHTLPSTVLHLVPVDVPQRVRVLPFPPHPSSPYVLPSLGVQHPLLLHHAIDPHVIRFDAVEPPQHGDEIACPYLEPLSCMLDGDSLLERDLDLRPSRSAD